MDTQTAFVSVPVPASRVLEVYALLAKSPASVEPEKPPAALQNEWSDAEIERAVRESGPPLRKLFRYLAEHADEWVVIEDLVVAVGVDNGTKSIGGMLGSYGVRTKNRYKKSTWFFEWRIQDHRPWYCMPKKVVQTVLRELNR